MTTKPADSHTSRLKTLLFVILVAVVALISALTLVPSRLDQGPDTTAYAYVGQIILDGGIPYRDARDSKPPLTFYLSALALYGGGVDLWSLWWLRIITVVITALLFKGLLHDLPLRNWIVHAGTLGFVIVVARPTWANTITPELLALPFQILCFRAGYRLLHVLGEPEQARVIRELPLPKQNVLAWALISGLLGGMTVLGKQTSGGVLITLGILLAVWGIRQWRQHARAMTWTLFWIAAGALIPLAGTAIFLAAHRALHDAFDAAIMYNVYYSQHPISLVAIVRTATTLNAVVPNIYLASSIFALVGIYAGTQRHQPPQRTLIIWLALTAILDFFTVNMAATGLPNYFLTPLPAFLALVLLGLDCLLSQHRDSRVFLLVARIGVFYVFGIVLLLPNVLDLILLMVASHGDPFRPAVSTAVHDYIEQHTESDDTVLVWGYQPAWNLLSGRRSPSRYFYAHPLALDGYSDAERVAGFVEELRENQPALIIDETLIGDTKTPPIDIRKMGDFYDNGGRHELADITPFREFVSDYCALERSMLTEHGPVIMYRCVYD